MRYALAAAALVCLAGLGLNKAQAAAYYCDGRHSPNPTMNYHCPYYIHCCAYWGPCSYGIRGPSDCPGQPVNGMPAPSYYPRLNGNNGGQAPTWHRYVRSPRDFFMLQY